MYLRTTLNYFRDLLCPALNDPLVNSILTIAHTGTVVVIGPLLTFDVNLWDGEVYELESKLLKGGIYRGLYMGLL